MLKTGFGVIVAAFTFVMGGTVFWSLPPRTGMSVGQLL
jgi:hypothetical protein